jgi:hypothetical protein
MPDVMDSVVALVLIPADVLGAIGLATVLADWGVSQPVIWAVPPTANPTSFRLRMQHYVGGKVVDSRDRDDIAALATHLAELAR